MPNVPRLRHAFTHCLPTQKRADRRVFPPQSSRARTQQRNPLRLLYPDPAADARPISSNPNTTGTPGLISTCHKPSRTPQPSSLCLQSTKATKPRCSRQYRNPHRLFSNRAAVHRAPSPTILCAPRRFSKTARKNWAANVAPINKDHSHSAVRFLANCPWIWERL